MKNKSPWNIQFFSFVFIILLAVSCKKKENPVVSTLGYDDTTTQWRLINSNKGLSDNEIMAIGEDLSGNVWVATQEDYNEPMQPPANGWWIRQTSTLQQVKKTGSVVSRIDSTNSVHLNGKVSGICFGAGDELHLAVNYYGLSAVVSRLNGSFTRNDTPGASSGNFGGIIKNDNGLWLSRPNDALYNFDNGTWTKYNSTNSSIPYAPQRFDLVKKNNTEFYMNTRKKLMIKWSGGISAYYMDDVWAEGMDVDSLGNVWTINLNSSSAGFNLMKYDGTTATLIQTPINYSSGTISSLAIDSHGNIWVATQGAYPQGLFKYDGTSWTNYTTSNSPIHSKNLTKLFVDSEGNLWIGSSDAGILVLNEFGTRN